MFVGVGAYNLPEKVFIFNPFVDFKKGVATRLIRFDGKGRIRYNRKIHNRRCPYNSECFGKGQRMASTAGGQGRGDEDEGSLPQGRVNRPEQVRRLAVGKIDRSAEAFGGISYP